MKLRGINNIDSQSIEVKSFADLDRILGDFIMPHDETAAYSLERIKQLLANLDSPQEKFQTIHVAGTSGKTSTSYYLTNMLDLAGYKVGLSVSPHIDEVNERLQIGLQPLPESQFCGELTQFLKILNRLSIKPTYFELFVAFAYWYFAKEKVDYAVMEVGLGGLLDGTNVIERSDKICIITDIGLDHTRQLGSTVAEVARQKAGIINPGNQVFMHAQTEEIMSVINSAVSLQKAELHLTKAIVEPAVDLPDFQMRNWSLAKAVCEYVLSKDGQPELSPQQWQATAKLLIPGRLEIIEHSGQIIVLDGAHNAQKMSALIKAFPVQFAGKSTAVLLAVADHKDVHLADIAREIQKVADYIIVTSFKSKQDVQAKSLDVELIAPYFERSQLKIQPDLAEALKELQARKEDILLVTGSLYLVSAVRKLLNS